MEKVYSTPALCTLKASRGAKSQEQLPHPSKRHTQISTRTNNSFPSAARYDVGNQLFFSSQEVR